MSVPSVSFIIPYYNLGIPLLDRSVQSVVRLGGHVDWEIWVIDDGTPTPEASEYVRRLDDSRIHCVVQQNMGLSEARNTGIRMARKEYIQFLDADDYLFLTPTLQMLQMLETYTPELLAFDSRKVYGTNEPTSYNPRILYRGDGCGFMRKHTLRGGAWGCVFRKEILGTLRFTPGIYHEDEEFKPLLFLNARDILATNLPVYAYFQRQDSIVHRRERTTVEKRFSDFLDIIIRLDGIRRKTQDTGRAKALERQIWLLCMSLVYTLLNDSPDIPFLRQTLERMRQAGFYPLPARWYSLPYIVVRTICFCPGSSVLASKLFKFIRFRQSGHPAS